MDNSRNVLKERKEAYVNAAALVTCMERYGYTKSDRDREAMERIIRDNKRFALPYPGRWGNAIAVALGINNYVAAKYLLSNAEKLDLRLDLVSSEDGFINPNGIVDEFKLSLLTHSAVAVIKCLGNDFETIRQQKVFADNNAYAKINMQRALHISDEDIESFLEEHNKQK